MSIPRNTPQTVADVPILQWASGHTQARATAKDRFAPFVGFHVERSKEAELDRCCAAAGVAPIDIRHPRPGGSEVKPHWSFGGAAQHLAPLRFHPITAGPPATTISGCVRLRDATAAAGLGLLWQHGETSRLAVRGLILVGDVPVLVQLSVRSTMTGFVLAALLDHVRVCEAADTMIDRAKHPELVALHELALPLAAGPEQVVGKGETTAQITPLISGHPAAIERAYVTSCWRSKAIHEAALAAWPGIVVWAAGERSGETNGDSHLDQAVEEALKKDAHFVHSTLEREQAALGAFITLEKPSREMLTEAAAAGVYRSPGWGRDEPRLQILTIEARLSAHVELRMPPTTGPFKAAQRRDVGGEQQPLW